MSAPKPAPPVGGPRGCNHKRRYDSISEARRVMGEHEDPAIFYYLCSVHACLHLGHPALRTSCATWREAMQAAADIQRQQRNPRRIRISKSGTGLRPWRIDWSKP